MRFGSDAGRKREFSDSREGPGRAWRIRRVRRPFSCALSVACLGRNVCRSRNSFGTRVRLSGKTQQSLPSVARAKFNAFTILELLIVLGLMVVILGIAWPQIQRGIQRSQLKQVAMDLKEQIAEARSQAILNGESWELRFQDFRHFYELGPVSGFSPPLQDTRTNRDNPPAMQQRSPVKTELDRSLLITTQSREILTGEPGRGTDRQVETIRVAGADESDERQPNSTKVRLDPGGRCQDIDLVVLDRVARIGIDVRVRGLTGQVVIGDFFRIEAVLEGMDESEISPDGADSNLELDLPGED